MKRPVSFLLGICLATMLLGCTMGQMVARTAVPVLDGSVDALNRETDLELAKAAMPANMKLIEGLINEDPKNVKLREYAAQGFYGYAFGFVEDEDHGRASSLYRRCFEHALEALRIMGLKVDPMGVRQEELEQALARLDSRAVGSLFWTASCWAKWIDMNRDEPLRVSEMGRAAALMNRALELDDTYYHAGPHVFFGVYYGSRPPMLGGDYAEAEHHFAEARRITGGKVFIVDVLDAQYLARQRLDKKSFHEKLSGVLHRPADLYPELALINKIAQRKANALLAKQEEWF